MPWNNFKITISQSVYQLRVSFRNSGAMYRQHIYFVILPSSQWAGLLQLNMFHRTTLQKYLWRVAAFSYIFELLPLTRSSLNFR
jgi:hypothetical protein